MYSQDVTIHINAEKAARLKELDITVHGGWLDEGVQPVNSQKTISITLEETDIEKLSLSVRQEDIKTVKNSLQWRKTLRDGMPYWHYDNHSIDALEAVLVELAEGQLKTPKGAVLIKTEDKDGIKFDLKIENQWIASYRPIKDYYTVTFNDDKELISRLISSVPDLVTAINVCKAEEEEK